MEYMKSEIYTNIVMECGNGEIIIGERYNVLFMNEPVTLRQIGSLFKNPPSEFTSGFGWKYIMDLVGLCPIGGKSQSNRSRS